MLHAEEEKSLQSKNMHEVNSEQWYDMLYVVVWVKKHWLNDWGDKSMLESEEEGVI